MHLLPQIRAQILTFAPEHGLQRAGFHGVGKGGICFPTARGEGIGSAGARTGSTSPGAGVADHSLIVLIV